MNITTKIYNKEVDVEFIIKDNFRKTVKITSVKSVGGTINIIGFLSVVQINKIKQQIKKSL